MSLLLLLFGWALTHARATTLPKHVAMCITGQLARLEPESLLRHVVAPNLHAFHFDVIYAMSASRVLFEHKFVAGQGANAPTRFVNSSSAVVLREALERVHRYVFGSAADKVPARVLEFTPALTSDTAWWGFLGLPRSTEPIWAGHQGGYNEWNILNMYHNHVKCAFEIERLEHKPRRTLRLRSERARGCVRVFQRGSCPVQSPLPTYLQKLPHLVWYQHARTAHPEGCVALPQGSAALLRRNPDLGRRVHHARGLGAHAGECAAARTLPCPRRRLAGHSNAPQGGSPPTLLLCK